jgi:PAS domain S-box-containing protein
MAKKKSSTAQEARAEVRPPQTLSQGLPEFRPQEVESFAQFRKTLARQKQSIKRISDQRFRTFLDSIPCLIMHVGTDQRVTLCNKRFAAFLNLTPQKTIGKTFWETLPDNYDSMRPRLLEALQGREVTFEQSFHASKERYFYVIITPDFALGGLVTGVFICLLDISDRKALEEKQRRNETRLRKLARGRAELLKRAEEASRVKDNFLATLSHELRTPLTSIVGWATLIKSRTIGADRLIEGISAIERNARIQSRLIEELLDISRITSAERPFEPASIVHIDDLVRDVVDSLGPTFAENRLRTEFIVSGPIPAVRGDRDRLQQVIMNLLSNALKFTPPGGNVQIEVNHNDAEVQVVVRDTGQGIPADFLPHVFDEFRQADMSSARRKGGLGLGLSIARRLVELHHGSIQVVSPGTGKGATFVVRLPAAHQ